VLDDMVGVDLSDVEVPELEPPTAELPEPEPVAASEPEPAETPLAGLAEEIAPTPPIEAGSPSEAAGVAVPADMVAQIAQRVVSQISEDRAPQGRAAAHLSPRPRRLGAARALPRSGAVSKRQVDRCP
jgi:hypothetical protein